MPLSKDDELVRHVCVLLFNNPLDEQPFVESVQICRQLTELPAAACRALVTEWTQPDLPLDIEVSLSDFPGVIRTLKHLNESWYLTDTDKVGLSTVGRDRRALTKAAIEWSYR